MTQATTRRLAATLVRALVAALAAGCSVSGNDDADKAGGSDAPDVLRLAVADDADQPDAPFARYFARRVSALSDGSVRVRVVWDAAGQDSPGYELGIARLVRMVTSSSGGWERVPGTAWASRASRRSRHRSS